MNVATQPIDAGQDIDYEALITEDQKPVDRIAFEKLYRLLTRVLYASWHNEGNPFVVLANVGWFYQRGKPAVVPDILLSLDVTLANDLQVKEGHSYYQWDYGKPPDVVIEFVSDTTGGEESDKKTLYARLRVLYYVVYDPRHYLSQDTLKVYELLGGRYRLCNHGPWQSIGLGLRLWEGKFEGAEDIWLRWCDANGEIIPTGEERAAIANEVLAQTEESLRIAEEANEEAEVALDLAKEETRKAQESARTAQESARTAQESARTAQERARVAEENQRQQQETIRQLEAEIRRLSGS